MGGATDVRYTPDGPALISRALASRWVGVATFVLVLAVPFVYATPYALDLYTNTAIFVMLAVGLNIVVGYCGLLDLGYAAFFAVGAYTSGVLSAQLHWPLAATLPVVVVATVVAGVVIGGPTLRLRSDYLAIVTLGFGEIIRITAKNLTITGGPSGIYGIPDFGISIPGLPDRTGNVSAYYVTIIVVAAAVLLAARLRHSRLGRAWLCIREDEDAAEAVGIRTYPIKLAAYIAGAIWGGMAGVLFGAHLSAISPESFVFLQSALVLMAVVLGGMGSTRGVVVGAIIITALPEVLRGAADYRYFVFGVLLIMVMIFRPQGLWPMRATEPGPARRGSGPGPEPGLGARLEPGPQPVATRGAVTGNASLNPTVLNPTVVDPTVVDPTVVVRDLRLAFGGVKAVDGLSFSVGPNQIVSVIGPNGAGKTSAFNCITGFYKPTGGTVCLAGEAITGRRPSAIAARGVARTFQNVRLFPDLNVLDNVRAGMHLTIEQSVFDALLHTPRYRRGERLATERAHQWLDFVGMRGDRAVPVRNLPYGEQRQVEIARALARQPRLVLLDEPAAGLNAGEKDELLDLIHRIRGLGVAVVLIEHDVGLVMRVSERVVVLAFGKVIADGTPAEVRRDPAVIEAYLGSEAEHEEVARVRETVAGSVSRARHAHP